MPLNDKFSCEEALETDKFVGVDQPFVYDVEDLMTTVAITGPNYFSQNANGTHSIMLKSAFRVFITMVDGEPRIGFFRDCSDSAPIGVSQVFRKEFAIISREANEKFQGDSFVFRFAGTFGRRTVFPCLETVRVRPGAGAGGARGAGGLPVDRRRGPAPTGCRRRGGMWSSPSSLRF